MDKSERSENLVKSELLRACKLLYRQKLVYATAGNVSHRCGDSIFITATGTSLGYVTPDSLVRLDMDGNVREGGRPSSEYRMHLAIYNKFPKIKAVVHTHPTAATTLACLQTPIKTTLLAEAELFLGEVACAPYADPGTAELAEKHGVSMTEVALAWLMTKTASPIAGATKLSHVEGAAKASELVLGSDELAYLEEPYVPHALVGVMAQNTPAAANKKQVWPLSK